jgi:hypothetical protein
MLAAWAMAFGTTYETLLEKVGGHGLEPVGGPDSPPRGWHSQEFVRVGLDYGFNVSHIVRIPTLLNTDGSERKLFSLVKAFDEDIKNEHHRGVLLLNPSFPGRARHAVAFFAGTIFDPSGNTYLYDDLVQGRQLICRPAEAFLVTP